MEEINARFEIVELAVKLGDMETVSIQVEKLRNLSLDDNLDEITTLLENRNFRQALFLMKHYASTLKDDFFEEESADSSDGEEEECVAAGEVAVSSEESRMERPANEKRIDGGEKVLTLDDLLEMSDDTKERVAEYRGVSVDETDINREEEPADAEEEEIERESPDSLQEMEESGRESAQESKIAEYMPPLFDESAIAEETAAISDEEESTETGMRESEDEESAQSVSQEQDSLIDDLRSENGAMASYERVGIMQEDIDSVEEESEEKMEDREEEHSGPDGEEDEDGDKDELYPPISYIEQKYRNMFHQYAPREESDILCEGVEEMLRQIAETGYSERDMERFLLKYREHKEKGDLVCSAQILLAAAATESKFAQFLLARELFTGDIIEQNHAEAFTQINSLAEKGFAEAICDLAQFYEYGIGIGKDRRMALLLYEEAQEMGVERAARHVERLKRGRGLLGLLKF